MIATVAELVKKPLMTLSESLPKRTERFLPKAGSDFWFGRCSAILIEREESGVNPESESKNRYFESNYPSDAVAFLNACQIRRAN